MITPLSAVRSHVHGARPRHVLVACSGGPDSLALAFLAAQVLPHHSVKVSAAAVDHGLQPDSDAVAAEAMRTCESFGIGDTQVLKVTVELAGEGLEAAARRVRRAALIAHAELVGAGEIWLGHTMDDQAETVLIGLTHGSGARSLAGMSAVDGVWVRPLLHCRRADVHRVLPPDVHPWKDPHNQDARFLRARVRHELLPIMADVLGDRAVVSLARSAELLARDNEALDGIAGAAWDAVSVGGAGAIELDINACAVLAPAVLARVLRAACLAAGVIARDLTMSHVDTLARLVHDRALQGPIALPGRVAAHREHDRLVLLPQSSSSTSVDAEDSTGTKAPEPNHDRE